MIGRTVSHYKIVEEVGGGGMGVVYRAEDTKLRRSVALKFLPPHLASDPEAQQRLLQEAHAISALQHDNICAIHEVDHADDGQLFICMDYYPGESLEKRLAHGPLSADEAIEITAQVARGLAEAHLRGIVHRDIKPANILITNHGSVKILDFGLARLVGTTRMTKEGSTVGTIAYMSPEQVRGEDVGPSSDVFSLGVVFQELLTGSNPFAAEHDPAMMHKILNVAPSPLRASAIKGAAQLQPILGRMLAKTPSERCSSADVTAALNRLQSASQSTRTGPNGRRRLVLTGAGLVVVVIAALSIWPRFRPVKDSDAAIAVIDFSDARGTGDRVFVAGLTRLLCASLTEISPVRVVSPELVYDVQRRLFGASDSAIRPDQALIVAREAKASLIVTGERVSEGDASVVVWRVVDTKTGRMIRSASVSGTSPMTLVDQIIAGLTVALADRAHVSLERSTGASAITTASPEAYRKYVEGMLAWEGGRAPTQVRGLIEQAIAIDTTFALACLDLGRNHAYYGENHLALQLVERAWRHKDRLGVRDGLRVQGIRYRLTNKGRECLAIYRELVQRWPDDLTVVQEFCDQLFFYLYWKEAAEVGSRALLLYPDRAGLAASTGGALQLIGRDREAMVAFRKAVRLHPEGGDYLDYVGRGYVALGFPDSAEIWFNKALEVSPPWPAAYEGRAMVAFGRGDYEEAIRILNQRINTPGVSDHEKVQLACGSYIFSITSLYSEAGRYREALQVVDNLKIPAGPASDLRYLYRIEALLRMKEWRAALGACESYRGDKKGWNAVLRGRALAGLDSVDVARAFADQIAGRWLDAPQPVDLLYAQIQLAAGRPKEALKLLEKVKAAGIVRPGPWDFVLGDLVAYAQYADGRPRQAAQTLEGTLRIYGGHAVAHYELAKIHEELGDRARARSELEQFLKLWSKADEGLPELTDARQRLARLKVAN